MGKQVSLKKNFLMNMLLNISSFIFPLITYPYVSRILSPVGMGKVTFATSLISYFSMIAQLGIPTYGIRACAKVRDNKEELSRTVHELLFINLAMTVISYIALAMCLIFIPRLREDRVLYLIISSTILLTSIGVEWMYKGLEQYTYITKRSVLFKFIALIAMFLLIHQKNDYVIYGAISIFAASASNILNFMYAHNYIYMHPVGNYHPMKHIKAVLVFFAMAVATTVYTNLDVVMLGFMKTDADVGYYNAAVKIKGVLVSLVTSLGAVLMPRSSYYVEHQEWKEFKIVSRKAIEFVFITALPLTVYFIIFAKQGIYFLSGSSYGKAIEPMKIIMPTLLFIGLSNITGLQVLVPIGREKDVLWSTIAGAIVDLIINAILIPNYASSGAAVGTLIAEAVVLVWQTCALSRYMIDLVRGISYWKMIISTGISSIGSIWVLQLNLGNFNTLLVSAIVFFGIYAVSMLVLKEDMVIDVFNQYVMKHIRRGYAKEAK